MSGETGVLSGRHPTYANPTILQVTCEIAFTPQSDDRLSAGHLFPEFSQEFSEIVPIGTAKIQFVVGAPIVPEAPQAQAATAAFRFCTASGARFVQLSKNNFVYQSSDPYTGWDDFREKLLALWAKAAAKLYPGPITKVGLRYVNQIPRTEEHQHISDWLQATNDIPESILTSKEHFLARIESSPKAAHLKLVTVANALPTEATPLGGIILDIDRVCTEQFEVSTDVISENLELLHNDVWDVFNGAVTSILKSRLSGQ